MNRLACAAVGRLQLGVLLHLLCDAILFEHDDPPLLYKFLIPETASRRDASRSRSLAMTNLLCDYLTNPYRLTAIL